MTVEERHSCSKKNLLRSLLGNWPRKDLKVNSEDSTMEKRSKKGDITLKKCRKEEGRILMQWNLNIIKITKEQLIYMLIQQVCNK